MGHLGTDTYLFHHLFLFVEEIHLDVSTHRQRLRKIKVHVLLRSPCVHWVRRMDFNFQLVHHKLRICKIKQCVIALPALCVKQNVSLCISVNIKQKKSIEENNRIETAEILIQKRQNNSGTLRALFWEQLTLDHASHLSQMRHYKRPPKSGTRGFYLYMANTFYRATLARLTELKMRNILEKADVTPMPIGFSETMRNLLTLAFYSRIPLEKKKEIKDCPVAWPEQERALWGEETFKQS